MSHVSDSDHRRLEAKVFADHCVVESHEISDVSRGLRRVPITKVWRTERLLGQGGFGEVHLQSQESDKDAKRALKIIPTRGVKLSLADCQRELTAMIEFTKPKYRNAAVFVEFIGWFQTDDAMFLAMEYMPLGDLEMNLKELESSPTPTRPPLPEEDVQEISRQILEGLKIMHAEGFAHRDLKPQNVFVVQKQPQWWVKLGDFGLSKKRTEGTAYRTQAGTQQYMAPELFLYVEELDPDTSEYTNAIDLWALGCIIYRIVTGAVPFPSLLSLKKYSRDPVNAKLNMPDTMADASEFVGSLLMPHPGKRPAATAALESTWLTTKKKPTINVNDTGASFDMLNISQSQNNYNTTSHKGLQSIISMPATNSPLTSSATKGADPGPLPLLTSETLSRPNTGEDQSKTQNYSNKWSQETVKNHFDHGHIPSLESNASLLHRSMSLLTRPATSALPKKNSNNELQARVKKIFSEQFQTFQDQFLPKKEESTISNIPAVKSKPLPLAKPVTEPDSSYGEVQSTTKQVAVNDVDSYRFHTPIGRVSTVQFEVVGVVSGAVDDPDPLIPAPPTRKSRFGEVIPDVPRTRMAPAPVERTPPPHPRRLRPSKKSPPTIPTDRESMPITQIKLIFDSYGIPYHEIFTKSQLLYVLDRTFPASGAAGRPFYYDAISNKFSWKDPHGSLPQGWESYLSHAGEEYYYDKSADFSTWDDPRISSRNARAKPYSDHVSLEQRISRPQLPSPRPKHSEMETVHPPKLTVQWAKNYATNTASNILPDMPADMHNASRLSHTTPQRAKFWMKALYDFDPQVPSDLRFSKGDIIRVADGKITDGWLVGELNGRKGSFPANYCQLVVWMRALYDFDPQYEGDLRLSARDLIEIKDVENRMTLPDGWLVGEVNGRKGMFPANYCDVVAAAPGPDTNGQASSGSIVPSSNIQSLTGPTISSQQTPPKITYPSPQAHLPQPYSSSVSTDAHSKHPLGPLPYYPGDEYGDPAQPTKRDVLSKVQNGEEQPHRRAPVFSELSKVVADFSINILTLTYKFKVRVTPNDTIESVKQKIIRQEDLREEDFFLVLKGRCLNESATIADYGIQLEDIIILQYRSW